MPITVPEARSIASPRIEVKRGDRCLDHECTDPNSRRKRSTRRAGSSVGGPLRTERPDAHASPFYWTRNLIYQIRSSHNDSASIGTPLGTGVNAGTKRASISTTNRAQDGRGFSPPRLITTIKSIACEVPANLKQPLSRLFIPDIHRILIAEKHVDSISLSTIWRILDAAAIKPWRHRSWIWSRDPLFAERAGQVLDLYERRWNGRRLRSDEFVISADEKTSIQARIRIHDTEMRRDRRGQRVEHEYERGGAWAYLAALDVHSAKVYGRVEQTSGIDPFHRLVEQVMTREPFASAYRVFWIVDQGSSHRPTTFPDRVRRQFRNARGVSLPVHASWLNQIEIYFSILQRKALTPNDFTGLDAVRERIHGFARRFNADRNGKPFDWKFTRADLHELLDRYADRALTHEAAEAYRDTG